MTRPDLEILQKWIPRQSHVLDLGCGDGALLHRLQNEWGVTGLGVDIDSREIIACLEKGVAAISYNLDEDLGAFEDRAFDLVVMTHTLQEVGAPEKTLREILRIGKKAVVSFPNMGHWYCRASLALLGRMPVSETLPRQWYESKNIHLCTIRDFEKLCADTGIHVLDKAYFEKDRVLPSWLHPLANMLAVSSVYLLSANK